MTKLPSLRNCNTYLEYVTKLWGKSDKYLDHVWDPSKAEFSDQYIYDLWHDFAELSEPALAEEIGNKLGYLITSTDTGVVRDVELRYYIGTYSLFDQKHYLVGIQILLATKLLYESRVSVDGLPNQECTVDLYEDLGF